MLVSSYITPKARKGAASGIKGRGLIAVAPIAAGELVAIKGGHIVTTAVLQSLPEPGGLGRKIAAAASFHGGRLAVAGDPSSPHLAAADITAAVYVAGAKDDRLFTTEQAALLEGALTDAGVDHTIEFYPAHHGFAVPDNPTFDAQADARHWAALDDLYRARLDHP